MSCSLLLGCSLLLLLAAQVVGKDESTLFVEGPCRLLPTTACFEENFDELKDGNFDDTVFKDKDGDWDVKVGSVSCRFALARSSFGRRCASRVRAISEFVVVSSIRRRADDDRRCPLANARRTMCCDNATLVADRRRRQCHRRRS